MQSVMKFLEKRMVLGRAAYARLFDALPHTGQAVLPSFSSLSINVALRGTAGGRCHSRCVLSRYHRIEHEVA